VGEGGGFEESPQAPKKAEGGRHSAFFDGYKPQFFFSTADCSGSVHFPELEVPPSLPLSRD